MAGIGFTLRRMLHTEGLGGPMRAFGYAAVVSSGPWISSSVALAVLGYLSIFSSATADNRIFLALVSYAFAFSLIGVGVCQMVASRYLADRLYLGDTSALAPAYAQLLVPLLLVQVVVAGVFLHFVPLPPFAAIAATTLYALLNGTWLVMIFLSAAHDFRSITLAFAFGLAVSVVAGLFGETVGGLAGKLAGFTLGYLVTYLWLLSRLDREFGMPTEASPHLWAYFRDYWQLALTGFAYNLGIWIDKILFWYQPGPGETVSGLLRAAPVYDNAMFLAYLGIVPALALFLLKVETDFYDQYRGYFSAIADRDSLQGILAVKARIGDVLRQSLGLLLKVQGLLTLGLVIFTPELSEWLQVSWLSVFVFRAGVLGSFFHVLHLITLILLQYFDFRKEACLVALTFLVTNGLFTWLSFSGGLPAYGFGYAASSAVTLLIGLWLLDRSLNDLEFHIFMKQPLS
ncbi:MAG: exopolysaccharide Pel transporter PelG [Candidatus Sericytochromatia bacterium]|nr:exopolysaccharide Pel transporter PelG [Candidatus Sericytochromatia bacterium]